LSHNVLLIAFVNTGGGGGGGGNGNSSSNFKFVRHNLKVLHHCLVYNC
jgi:hypothetical protein